MIHISTMASGKGVDLELIKAKKLDINTVFPAKIIANKLTKGISSNLIIKECSKADYSLFIYILKTVFLNKEFFKLR